MLLLATLTVLLYFVFGRMTIGDMGALIAITTVLNSGIDAVQHFLTTGALLLFLTFHRRGSTGSRDTVRGKLLRFGRFC